MSTNIVDAMICPNNWLHGNKEHIVIRQYLDEVDALNDSLKTDKLLLYLIFLFNFFY